MRTRLELAAALLGGFCLAVPWQAYAAELADGTADFVNSNKPLDEYSLAEQLVTAQRMSRTDLETPAATTVITAAQIARSGYRTVYEAIDQQLGAENSSYGGETGQDFGTQTGGITLRGYKGGALVLLNGVPMNLRNSSSTENIPIGMVDRIEIVKGAGSTLYGGEAVGGVVNVILKKPTAGHTGGSASITGGNAFQKTETTYYDPNVMIDVSREWTKNRPHANAFGPDKVSYTDYWIGKGQKNRLGMSIRLTDELNIHYNYLEGAITRGGQKYVLNGQHLTPTATKYDESYNDYRQTVGISYQGKENGVKAALGYNYRRSDGYDRVKNTALAGNGTYDSLVLDLQKNWQFRDDALVGGYFFKHETGRAAVTGICDKRTNQALYASYTKQLTNRFRMTLGLRGEFIQDDVKDQDVFLPQLQTDYKIDDHTAWYINIGRAFEMPDIDPVTRDALGGTDLKPEKGWNYETGLKLARGDESWKLALYHMDMSDKLGWQYNNATQRYYLVNKGDFRNTGLEVEYDRRLSDCWGLKLGASFSNPEVKDPSLNRGWTQDNARLATLIGLDYHQAKWQGNLSLRYLGDREYYDAAASGHASGKSQDVPAKVQLNLNLDYRCDAANDLKLGIYNILDHENYSDRYGNLELSRNFQLTFTHQF